MKGRIKKHKKLAIVFIIICVVVLINTTINWNTYIYSKRLINSIEDNNMQKFDALLKNKNGKLNCPEYRFGKLMEHLEVANFTPLEVACQRGNYKAVKKLVDKGADVNMQDDTLKSTPLIMALSYLNEDRYKIARLLIEKGADIDYKDSQNCSPLALVTKRKENEPYKTKKEGKEIFKYIWKHSKERDLRGYEWGDNILEVSYAYNNIDAIEYLIERKYFRINIVFAQGVTLLMYAVKNEKYGFCRFLLKEGVDVSLKDHKGKTAYDYAKESGNKKIIKLLEEYQ